MMRSQYPRIFTISTVYGPRIGSLEITGSSVIQDNRFTFDHIFMAWTQAEEDGTLELRTRGHDAPSTVYLEHIASISSDGMTMTKADFASRDANGAPALVIA